MPRSLGRNTIGFDGRSGRKERYRDLIEDGEIPGLLVKRGTEDLEHPQKKLRRVGPDRQALWRPAPESIIDGVTVYIGLDGNPDALWEGRIQIPGPVTVLASAISVSVDNDSVSSLLLGGGSGSLLLGGGSSGYLILGN